VLYRLPWRTELFGTHGRVAWDGQGRPLLVCDDNGVGGPVWIEMLSPSQGLTQTRSTGLNHGVAPRLKHRSPVGALRFDTSGKSKPDGQALNGRSRPYPCAAAGFFGLLALLLGITPSQIPQALQRTHLPAPFQTRRGLRLWPPKPGLRQRLDRLKLRLRPAGWGAAGSDRKGRGVVENLSARQAGSVDLRGRVRRVLGDAVAPRSSGHARLAAFSLQKRFSCPQRSLRVQDEPCKRAC